MQGGGGPLFAKMWSKLVASSSLLVLLFAAYSDLLAEAQRGDASTAIHLSRSGHDVRRHSAGTLQSTPLPRVTAHEGTFFANGAEFAPVGANYIRLNGSQGTDPPLPV